VSSQRRLTWASLLRHRARLPAREQRADGRCGARRQAQERLVSTKSEAEDKKSALADLDTSLQELRTDYLDIWYLHSKDEPESLYAGLLEAVQFAKAQGKARFVGLSTHSAETMVPAAIKTGVLDVVLITYNYTMGSRLDPVIVPRKKRAGRCGDEGDGPREEGSEARGGTAALKWVLKNKGVRTTIPSMVDMDQLDQNFRTMSSAFSPADQAVLTACLDQLAPVYCRMCGNCRGMCPRGLPVADMLRYLTYADGYGQFALGRESSRAAGGYPECPLCGLRNLHRRLPQRRAGIPTPWQSPGSVRVSGEVLAGVPAFQASIPLSSAATRSRGRPRISGASRLLQALEAPGWTGLSRVSRDLQ